MFSLELRINNGLVGHAYCVNELVTEEGIGVYNIEYYRLGKEPSVMKFRIAHKRDEGAEKLALLILREADKRLKNYHASKKQ